MAANAERLRSRLPQTRQILRSIAPSAARRLRSAAIGTCALQVDPEFHYPGVGRPDRRRSQPAQQPDDRVVGSKTDRDESLEPDGPRPGGDPSSSMLAMPRPRQESATATATSALLDSPMRR